MENIAFNYTQCIKQASNWGSDTFTNICNGTVNTVNWGSLDWTRALTTPIFFGLLFAGLILMTTVKVDVVKADVTKTTKVKKV